VGFGFLPTHVGGSGGGSHSGSGKPIKKIRFVIAVNPKHYKIPFELKNIPLRRHNSRDLIGGPRQADLLFAIYSSANASFSADMNRMGISFAHAE